MEGVGCFVLEFLPVETAGEGCGFDGGASWRGDAAWRWSEGGEVAGGWGEELDLSVTEGTEWYWGFRKRVFEKT